MVKTRLAFRHHKAFSPHLIVLAVLCASLTTLFWSSELFAQTPHNFRVPLVDLPNVESSEADVAAEPETLPDHGTVARRVIVDADPGVDDAAALIWLLSQRRYDVNVVGIVATSGNTNVDDAVSNISLLMGWLGEETIPIVRGADKPLVQSLSHTPYFIHGPDGLWYTPKETVEADFSDATAFYCSNLQPGTLVIALAPLTTIATALEGCPGNWEGVEIVSLGGAIDAGNQTPVTEFNYWQDPEAVEKVLTLTAAQEPSLGVTLQIVLADAFRQFEIAPSDIRQLDRRGNDAIQNLLVPALQQYMLNLTGGGPTELPDPSAVIYALDNRLGTSQRVLVDVLSGDGIPEVARGQTIVGTEFNEIITMVLTDEELSGFADYAFSGDPNFNFEQALGELLYGKTLDNAFVVTDIDARRMQNIFIQGLRSGLFPTSANGEATQESDYDNHIFVPQVER